MTISGLRCWRLPAIAMLLFWAPWFAAHATGPGEPPAFSSPPEVPATPWDLAPARLLTSTEVDAEAARMRVALAHEVPHASGSFRRTGGPDWVGLAKAQLALKPDLRLDHAQILVVIDRSLTGQELALVLARGDRPWEVLGGTRVSTGQEGRFDHYVTPTGVFPHTADILDYRAEGTLNVNGIRGLGVKGMRVWDFGWQMATKGWRRDGEQGQIRMEMHATDPTYLASRIGRTASQGCVRIPDAMNHFLDFHGILDVDYERAANDDIRYRALLMPGRRPSSLAGNLLVVVDSTSARVSTPAMVSSR